ncbi:tyrosine-type recombinase/integrase [Eoetvoesiella caeni]
MKVKRTFSSKRELDSLPGPDGDKPSEEYSHTSLPGFIVVIMRPRKSGEVRKTYYHRHQVTEVDAVTGKKKSKTVRDPLGLAAALDGENAITYDAAVKAYADARAALKSAEVLGPGGQIRSRLTLDEAFKRYDLVKPNNREATKLKDRQQFERYFSHIKDKFLDELTVEFWLNFIRQLRDGMLVVRQVQGIGGELVPETRGPLANATLTGIMNTASLLYEIANKLGGLAQHMSGENPAKAAKESIGAARKRKSYITLKQLGRAWNASEQLCPPWWRDLFRFYVLTGLRNSLVRALQFSEIDFVTSTYKVSPHKSGTKRHGSKLSEDEEDISIPLSTSALEILARRRQFAPDPDGPVWFAPERTRGRKGRDLPLLSDPRHSWISIERAIGGTHFTPHDLRRTFATAGAISADDVLAVSLLMMHSGGSLSRALGIPAITFDYINTDEAQDKMRAAANAIATYVQRQALEAFEGRRSAVPVVEPKLPPLLEEALAEE